MYLQRSNVYDQNVKAVQGMLNAALMTNRYRGKWNRLEVDGYFGDETEKAVKAFQYYHDPRIDQTGIVGDTTYKALLGTSPVMSAASPKVFLTAAAPSTVKASAQVVDNPSLWEKGNQIVSALRGVLDELDSIAKSETKYLVSLSKNGPQAIKGGYYSIVTKMDKRMSKMKAAFASNQHSMNVIAKNQPTGKMPIGVARHKQGIISQQEALIRANQKIIRNSSDDMIASLRKINLAAKIDSVLKKYGLTGEIPIAKLKNVKIKFKVTGSTYLLLFSLKDIIGVLLRFSEYGTEEWKSDLSDAVSQFMDDLVVGLISTVLAELLVGGALLLGGASISAGAVVVIVLIVSVIIGLIISYLMEESDISFAKYAMNGYSLIGNYVASFL